MRSQQGRSAAGSIHVAGILDLGEAEMLIDCGIRHLGFPLVLDHHREDLGTREAARIVERLGTRACFFPITYLGRARAILELCRSLAVSLVQLHGTIEPGELARLREARPGLRIIKSLIVRGNDLDTPAAELEHLAPWVDAFITDSFDPATGACGATGKTHDWSVSRRLVALSPRPVILAGGLHPGNVRAAIAAVRPAGVDVHTGIEGADGRKQRALALRFVAEARAGFADLTGEPD